MIALVLEAFQQLPLPEAQANLGGITIYPLATALKAMDFAWVVDMIERSPELQAAIREKWQQAKAIMEGHGD